MESIKRLSTDSLKREDRAVKREKAAIEQGKAIQACYEASKVKVDDLKSELEAADQVRLELVSRLQKAQERMDAQDWELRRLREEKDEREVVMSSEIKALQEEVESIYALARFTARAALMRQHTRGLNPMAKAQEELDFFLSTIRDEDDLDRDDQKDMDEDVIVQEKGVVHEGEVAQKDVDQGASESVQDVREEVLKDDTSGSAPIADIPPS